MTGGFARTSENLPRVPGDQLETDRWIDFVFATCLWGPVFAFSCLSFYFHFTAVYDKVSKSVADVGRSTQFAVNKL